MNFLLKFMDTIALSLAFDRVTCAQFVPIHNWSLKKTWFIQKIKDYEERFSARTFLSSIGDFCHLARLG